MVRLFVVFSLLSLMMISAGCQRGNGVAKTKLRALEPFSFVSVNYPARVEITQGTPQEIDITADDNLVDNIETRVSNDTLYIMSDSKMKAQVPVVIRITIPKIEGILATSTPKIFAKKIRAQNLELKLAEEAQLVIEGQVNDLKIKVENKNLIDAVELISRRVEVISSGESIVNVHPMERLEVRASKGVIRYAVEPAKMEKQLGEKARVEKFVAAAPDPATFGNVLTKEEKPKSNKPATEEEKKANDAIDKAMGF